MPLRRSRYAALIFSFAMLDYAFERCFIAFLYAAITDYADAAAAAAAADAAAMLPLRCYFDAAAAMPLRLPLHDTLRRCFRYADIAVAVGYADAVIFFRHA